MNLVNISEHTFIDKDFGNKKINIIDLGACLGEFSGEISRIVGEGSKIIMIEANPVNFDKIPNIENSVKLNRFISTEKYGSTRFLIDPNSPYNGSALFSYFQDGVSYDISNITLSEIVSLFNIERIDLMKIDIEGAEYSLLENMPDEILDITDQITVEFHDFIDPEYKERTQEIVNKMKNSGYSVINNGLDYKYGSDYYDTLFYK